MSSIANLCVRWSVAELWLVEEQADDETTLLYVLPEDADVGWKIIDFENALASIVGGPITLLSKKYLSQRDAERFSDARKIFPPLDANMRGALKGLIDVEAIDQGFQEAKSERIQDVEQDELPDQNV